MEMHYTLVKFASLIKITNSNFILCSRRNSNKIHYYVDGDGRDCCSHIASSTENCLKRMDEISITNSFMGACFKQLIPCFVSLPPRTVSF